MFLKEIIRGQALLRGDKECFLPKKQDLKGGILNNYCLLALSELPSLKGKGPIVTANNKHYLSDISLGQSFASSLRAWRITHLLKGKNTTKDSMEEVMCDVQNNKAFFLLPLILKEVDLQKLTSYQRKFLEKFKDWDFKADLSSVEQTLFSRIIFHFMQISKIQSNHDLPRVLYERLTRTDLSVKENLNRAIKLALEEKQYFRNPWGQIHLFSRKSFHPYLRGLSSFKYFSSGSAHSVNVGSGSWQGKYFLHKVGSSLRLLASSNNSEKRLSVWFSYLGPLSEFDFPKISPHRWQRWLDCKLDPVIDFEKMKGYKRL